MKKTTHSIVFTMGLMFIFLLLGNSVLSAAEPGKVKRETAASKQVINFNPSKNPAKKEFDFGGYTAWLTQDGVWQVSGIAKHTRLRCGRYRMGMRFGAGSPGCMNVKWITEANYVTSHKQCNSAQMKHKGVGENQILEAKFDSVSCAERLIKCTGTCD